uniref:Transposase n=1 Tax=Verticillium dahliae TaxID=27337 RepID=G8GKM5_VERDA|nr:transposase [Verticillium dahliae]
MSPPSQERQLQLALQAIQNDPDLSIRAATNIFGVPRMTLTRRLRGITSQRDRIPLNRNLTELEELTIVQYILELNSRAFPPRLCEVEDMANRLLADRDAPSVGKRWASNFVRRQPELKTRFFRRYDYQRAQCEDPEAIRDWFALVKNTIAKYGIAEPDIYNFDETGFMMGVIGSGMVVTNAERRSNTKMVQPGGREWVTVIQGVGADGWCVPPFIIMAGKNHLSSWYEDSPLPHDWVIATTDKGWTTNEKGLEWIQHFDKHTKPRRSAGYRLLILDGHQSHHSVEFELYCKENNIITLCMPPHSSHLLQPLDVGCFGPLKQAYGRQIEKKMRAGTSHITKEDFFPAFFAAFKEAMTERNIKGGFRGAGLVPMSPEIVVSKLDVKLRTPTPVEGVPDTSEPWVSQTPHNPIEASCQSEFIKGRIARHQGSSPTSILNAIDHFTKGTRGIMHQLALLKSENQILRDENATLSKRRRAKKTRLRQGGSLTLGEGQEIQTNIEVQVQINEETRQRSSRQPRDGTKKRRCGVCGEPGHNARTCQLETRASEEEDFK